MATAELHPAILHRPTNTNAEAGTHAATAAPEWLFDVSAMAGSVGGLTGGAIAGAAVGGLEGIALGTAGVILGGLLGATLGRYVVMPVWAALTGTRPGHG